MSLNQNKEWNKGHHISSIIILLKVFILSLSLTVNQRILAYKSGITTALQAGQIDLAGVYVEGTSSYADILFMLENIWKIFTIHVTKKACKWAKNVHADIKIPRVHQRQVHHQNAATTSGGSKNSLPYQYHYPTDDSTVDF